MPGQPSNLEVLALICDHEHWKLLLCADEISGCLVLMSLDVLNEAGDLIACAAVGSARHLQEAASECNATLLELIDQRAA